MSDKEELTASASEGEEDTPVVEDQDQEEAKEPTPPEPEPAPPQNQNSNNVSKGGKKAKKTKRVQLNPPKSPAPQKEDSPQPTENNTEEGEEENEEEVKEEAGETVPPIDFSKILNAFRSVFTFFGGLFRKVFGFIQALFLRVFNLTKCFVPVTFAVGLFTALVYAVGTYCVGDSSLNGFDARFQSIVRASVWANSPTVLALLVNYVRPHNLHKRFIQQSVEDSVILFFNSIILATYAEAECFHWVSVIYIITSLYKLCLWTSQNFLSSRIQYVFSAPTQLLHIWLGLYNLYSITCQDLGFSPQLQPQPLEEEVAAEGPDWKYPDMCGVMEKLFCKPE